MSQKHYRNKEKCWECGESFMSNPECQFCRDSLSFQADSVGEGKACNVRPFQQVHGSSNQDTCSDCMNNIGSNPQNCMICESFLESSLNPAQPPIHYDTIFGPLKGSFGPCTHETTKRTLGAFKASFEASKKNGFPFTGINNFKRSASLIRGLLSNRTILGIEGYNNSCYYIVGFWMLSQGNMHERINTDCLSGHILYKILWDLRAGLFVGRDIVEAFRLSLQEYPLVQRSKSDFEKSMDDVGYLLGLLEDHEVGILKQGPILSNTGCSFLVHESIAVEHASIQEALCASVSSPSPVPENRSIILFQLCQQKSTPLFTGQHLGTNYEFPRDGVILAEKFLRPKMFIIYKSQHYLVVLCVGDSYFLANSRSAFQCGHYLPEMREISREEAMELFRTQAHTIVFECIGNAYAPPTQPRSEQSGLVPPHPTPCASGPLVTSPAFPPLPPLAHCEQVAQPLQHPHLLHAPCVNHKEKLSDSRFLPFLFDYGIFRTETKGFKKFWSYSYEVRSDLTFMISGECDEQAGSYSEYELNGTNFLFTMLKIKIQTEYYKFIENCE